MILKPRYCLWVDTNQDTQLSTFMQYLLPLYNIPFQLMIRQNVDQIWSDRNKSWVQNFSWMTFRPFLSCYSHNLIKKEFRNSHKPKKPWPYFQRTAFEETHKYCKAKGKEFYHTTRPVLSSVILQATTISKYHWDSRNSQHLANVDNLSCHSTAQSLKEI